MSGNKMSLSMEWRVQGNQHYKKVTDGLSPILSRSSLESALNCYHKAEGYAGSNMMDLCSAAKNIAMASHKLAMILVLQREKDSLIEHYLKQAMVKFNDAWKSGVEKGAEWRLGVQTMSLECMINIQDRLEAFAVPRRIQKFEPIIEHVLGLENKAMAFSLMVQWVFGLAVTNIIDKDFKSALSHLKDCYYPVSEGMKYMVTEQIKDTFEMYQMDIFIQTCVAESMQALEIADDLFQTALVDEEAVNYDLMWDVVDWYRRVIDLTRDKDILLEAIAHSRLGKLYEKVLKLDGRAREYYKKCLELANTLIPRAIHEEDWYQSASKGLSRYQQEDLQKEEEKNRKETDEILKKHKDQLDELKKNHKDMSKVQFLEFIYKKYPPKNEKHKLGTVPKQPESDQIKKLYRKAVVHYHPDKVTDDKDWKVMTQEIVKLLTSHYEYFKGCGTTPTPTETETE